MIFNAIFYALTAMAAFLIGLLPDADAGVVEQMGNVVANIVGYIQPYNAFFPVDTLLQCLGIFLTVEGALFTWKVVAKLLNAGTAGHLKV
jgi:hypothetical protein